MSAPVIKLPVLDSLTVQAYRRLGRGLRFSFEVAGAVAVEDDRPVKWRGRACDDGRERGRHSDCDHRDNPHAEGAA